jgi:transcriptional regulator with GAF, ATPase, and Fis domain
MALVALSPSRSGTDDILHPAEHLLVSVAGAFSAVDAEGVEEALSHAVEEIAAAFRVDECTIVKFGRASPSVAASWASDARMPCTDADLSMMPWTMQRLSRNAVVAVASSSDFPQAAAQDREWIEGGGLTSRLAVPIALGPRVAYGIMIASCERFVRWGEPVIERLRLVGEMIGSGLMRLDQAEALKASQAQVERMRTGLEADAVYLEEEARNRMEAEEIIGESATLRVPLARMAQVAPLDATVLLLGETGTGKELFARALHERSRRRHRMLVRVNCAALPASLIESELFGHEKGAFTGAVTARQGRFELADGGTIFLDEIGDLAPELQAKLLRVLQEGEFERVGSSKTRQGDVRVIAGTHVNLEKAVAEGRFRADLYYRLSVFPIALPPLRERREDISQLVWFFIHRRQRDLGRRITRVPAAVMEALQRHDWPGNVRELENVIERAMIRSTDGTLQLDDRLHADPRLPVATDCGDSLDAVQRAHIERVLRECGGRINGEGNAAVRLGIHPNTLRFRIKKLGVSMPERKKLTAR